MPVSGGARRDRTADLYNAIVALSQLSYGPESRARNLRESAFQVNSLQGKFVPDEHVAHAGHERKERFLQPNHCPLRILLVPGFYTILFMSLGAPALHGLRLFACQGLG